MKHVIAKHSFYYTSNHGLIPSKHNIDPITAFLMSIPMFIYKKPTFKKNKSYKLEEKRIATCNCCQNITYIVTSEDNKEIHFNEETLYFFFHDQKAERKIKLKKLK